MADPYAAFSSPVSAGGADPYAAFSSPVQMTRMTLAQMKAAHPEEYDPNSEAYKNKYGARGPNVTPASIAIGTSENALNLGTSAASVPLSGIAGILQGAKNLIAPGTPADERIAQVQQALTYAPRTEAGQNLQATIAYPFQKLEQGSDVAGDAASRVTHSPAVGAFVKTVLQMAPAAILHEAPVIARGVRGLVEKPAAPTPRIEPTISSPEAAAQNYVASRTSLDWNSLSDTVKARLTDIARNAKTLERLDPAAVERQAGLESLPVPLKATRGQLTRDRGELANEGTLAATTSGADVAAIRDAQSPGIIANLEVLKGKVSGTGKTRATAQSPEQVGMSVQDSALRAKAQASKANYDALYEKARATEPDAAVPSTPIVELLDKSPAIQHLGFMSSWLKRAGIEGDQPRSIKLSELADLREEASGIAATGGTDGFYAGKVVRAIDAARQAIPAAAKAWKSAEQAFAKHKQEFSDQGAVAQLVENKSRTDRVVALEDTFNKTVIGGSIEDLNNVKRSLLTGNEGDTSIAGRKAWRDIRAQTIQHIIDESTKSSATLPNGSTPVSAAGMQRAINSIGPEKLDSIFGPGTARMVDRIMQVTKDLRTEPPRIHPGSSTMGNVVAFLERNLNKLPILGDLASGTVKAVQKVREMGAASRESRAAQITPLEAAQTASRNAIAKANNAEALRRAAPFGTSTQGRNR